MRRDGRLDAPPFERNLARVVRRLWIAHASYSVAAGVALGTVLHLAGFGAAAGWAGGVPPALVMAATSHLRSRRRAATILERAAPQSRNIIITAEEVLRHPDRCSPWMRDRIIAEAAQLTTAVKPQTARALVAPACALVAVMAISYALSGTSRATASLTDRVRAVAASAGLAPARLTVAIDPPPYAQRPPVRLVDPSGIEALAGSTARVSVDGDARGWRLRFGASELAWSPDATAVVTLNESGYFALEPAGGSAAASRLIPVTVIADRAPAVRINAPARDLLVPDASRTIAVTTVASDDLALESLQLRYTKVSGTGEDFEFVEGTLPLGLTRTSDRAWEGAATVSLAALRMEPGDSLVYRAVARDRRPGGRGEASSDTFFIEVAGPGQVALEGFDLPPEQERYALSQQMVVLKIERLRARERAMPRDEVRETATAIAAEQRAVRAYFIFLMGGHVEDEEVEAEHSNEIQEGRLENTARREISTAVHLMTRAEQGLVALSTVTALPPAKSAVEALQRAFGRNRYILRTPPSRAEIDPSRRLSGSLSGAGDWRRDDQRLIADDKAARLDLFVRAASDVAKRLAAGEAAQRAWFATLAERGLVIEAGVLEWQAMAMKLTALADASDTRPGKALLAALNEAVKPAVDASQARARARVAPSSTSPLRRAWAQAVKR